MWPSNYQKTAALMLVLLLSGCESLTSMLFYPQTQYLQTPQRYALAWQSVELKARDGTRLSNWYLPAVGETKARVLFLHGNGENISTHLNAVAWLPAEGYAVFLLDYRGYGQSDGEPLLPAVFQDIHAAHEWLLSQNEDSPVVLMGQSIGGALGLSYAGSYRRELPQFDALVIESAPASLPQVAREAMAKHWLTWLLQVPAQLLLPNAYDAELNVKSLANEPIMLLHGTQDSIVSIDHLQQLQDKLPKAKVLRYPDGHIRGFASQSVREAVTDFLTPEGWSTVLRAPPHSLAR
ncbi:alpha/beta hydrolase [Allohahella marinimesophila]